MPTYKVPAEKYGGPPAVENKPHQPCICIPANEKIMKVFEIGQKAEVTLLGTIKGMSVNDQRSELQLEVDSVTAYPSNEYTKLAADGDGDESA